MIREVIVTLKEEKTGSSQYAITQLPPNFRMLLLYKFKKLVAAGKLVKVKGSFKLRTAKLVKTPSSLAKKKVAAAKPKPKLNIVVSKPKVVANAAKGPAKAKPAAKPKSAQRCCGET
ncbi:hypothetical protein RIF29_33915 [Crotalaria pallida]|uniref:H15 domain-containing protein n=1 Tax=Crotalaria pallida TaxID=3830 RepID=A0AAN9HQZ7_CROPI